MQIKTYFLSIALTCFSYAIFLTGCAPVAESLIISEFLASNIDGLVAENGETFDWIELYNPTRQAVSLAGWHLTDKPDNPKKWAFPDIEIAPNDYLVVFASGLDRNEPNLHTNFSLSVTGEYLALMRPDGSLATAYEPTKQFGNVSFGVKDNVIGYFNVPTPGVENTTPTRTGLMQVAFSHPRGLYEEPFQLHLISAVDNANIVYTTDGSWPSLVNGTRYSAPLDIEESTIIRAVAYEDEILLQSVNTHTYIFPEQVLLQSDKIAGFPESWTNYVLPADYEMDPDVVAGNETDLLAGLRALPIVSLSFDNADLFENALYMFPEQKGVETERLANFEYIDLNSETTISTLYGVRIHGRTSRVPTFSTKYSFRLLKRTDLNAEEIPNTIFSESPIVYLDDLILRAHFNDSWVQNYESERLQRAQYARDSFIRSTYLEMGHPTPSGEAVHLFLNGLYWGMYELVQRPNAHFASAHFLDEGDEWEIFTGRLEDDIYYQHRETWDKINLLIADFHATGDPAIYQQLTTYIDVDNLIDFAILNIWAGNTDWSVSNFVAYRPDTETGKFRFTVWDAEYTLLERGQKVANWGKPETPSGWHEVLLQHPDYRQHFVDQIYHHIFMDGTLNIDRSTARYRDTARQIEPAIPLESARWGDHRRDVWANEADAHLLYTPAMWANERERVLQDVLPGRAQALIDQLIDLDWYPAIDPPHVVLDGVQLYFVTDAPDTLIYYTLDGTDPRLPGGDVAPNALVNNTVTLKETVLLSTRVKRGSEWSALHQELIDVSAVSALAFSEIYYHPTEEDELTEYVGLHNYGDVPIALDGMQITGEIQYQFSHNTVIAPGQTIRIAYNPIALQAGCPSISVSGKYTSRLSNTAGKLHLWAQNGTLLSTITYGQSQRPIHKIADGEGGVLIRDPNAFHLAQTNPLVWSSKPFCAAPQLDRALVQRSQLISVTGNVTRPISPHFIAATGTLGEFGSLFGYRVTADDETDVLLVDLLVQSIGVPDRSDYFAFIEGWNDQISIKGNSVNWVSERWPEAGEFVILTVPVSLPAGTVVGELPINMLLFSNQDGGVYAALQDGQGLPVDRLDLGVLDLTDPVLQRVLATP